MKTWVNTRRKAPSAFAEMQFLHIKNIGALGVAGALLLAGCGGGASPTPKNNGPFTVDGSIESRDFYDGDNDRYYDVFVTETTRSGTAQIEMTSYDVDSQIYIYRRQDDGSYDLIDQDDDSGDGPDALARFDVKRGEVYRVIATSSLAREAGYYSLFFSRELGRPAVVLPRENARTADGLTLPKMPVKTASPPRSPAKATQ